MLLPALVFGLIAWVIPMLGLRTKFSKQTVLGASLTAATLTVLIVLMEINNRVLSNDTSFLLDTLEVTTFGVAVMLIGTIISNTVYAVKK